MAVLCAVLGPMLVFMSLVGIAAQRLARHLVLRGYAPPMASSLNDMALDFSVRSTVISVPLGLLLLVSGVRALSDLAKGRRILRTTAWVTAAAMLGLGVMWSLAVEAVGLGVAEHVGGWLGHGFQALLAAWTARWLDRADVAAACDGA